MAVLPSSCSLSSRSRSGEEVRSWLDGSSEPYIDRSSNGITLETQLVTRKWPGGGPTANAGHSFIQPQPKGSGNRRSADSEGGLNALRHGRLRNRAILSASRHRLKPVL